MSKPPKPHVRCDLHGKMTVELPVPVDAQEGLGLKKLAKRVRTEDGETIESVTAELQARVDQARSRYPMRITIDVQAHHDETSRSRIIQALRTTMGALDIDDPLAIAIEKLKPRK